MRFRSIRRISRSTKLRYWMTGNPAFLHSSSRCRFIPRRSSGATMIRSAPISMAAAAMSKSSGHTMRSGRSSSRRGSTGLVCIVHQRDVVVQAAPSRPAYAADPMPAARHRPPAAGAAEYAGAPSRRSPAGEERAEGECNPARLNSVAWSRPPGGTAQESASVARAETRIASAVAMPTTSGTRVSDRPVSRLRRADTFPWRTEQQIEAG